MKKMFQTIESFHEQSNLNNGEFFSAFKQS